MFNSTQKAQREMGHAEKGHGKFTKAFMCSGAPDISFDRDPGSNTTTEATSEFPWIPSAAVFQQH